MICERESCTGCMACYSACRVGAITINTDLKGFYVPEVNTDLCITCGMCKKVCPSLSKELVCNIDQKTFACWSINDELRLKSTSGGVFTGLAQYIFTNDGTVFGAKFDDAFRVVHAEAVNSEQLEEFRKSKYVQSYIGDTYRTIKERLKCGKLVLFTGTPCQNAGLRHYLGRTFDNLVTVDIVCHGVPSPLVFSDYIEYIKKTVSSDISGIQFRYKKPSWSVYSMKIDFLNNEYYISDTYTDPYLVGYSNDFFSRECCYKCKYTNLNRPSDLTIADFWGYVSENRKFRNDEKGISLVLINSTNGNNVFNQIIDNYIVVPKSIKEAMVGNKCLSKPYAKNPLYEDFWSDYLENRDFEFVKQKYFYKRKPRFKNRVSRFINDHSYLLSKSIRVKYVEFKNKLK